MSVEKEVEVIGTNDLPSIEIDSIDDDEDFGYEIEDEEKDSEESEDDQEETDSEEEDSEEEEEESEEDDNESDEDDDQEDPKENLTVHVNDIFVKEQKNTEYKTVQQELEDLSYEYETISSRIDKPQKPADEYDEEAMAEYRADLTLWKTDQAQQAREIERLNKRRDRLAAKAQNAFKKDFKPKQLEGFQDYMTDKSSRLVGWISGDVSLYEYYERFLRQKGRLEDLKKVETLKKKKAKIKPLNLKKTASGASGATGGNGFPTKFKYANRPEFKELVSQYKGKTSPVTGKKYTASYIDDLCKSELQNFINN